MPPAMPTILIEEDHFLKIVPVILDPATVPEHRRAVADFFAHDVPDFLGWCEGLRARIPSLYPARVVWARDQAELLAKLPEADGVIVESLEIDRAALALGKRLKVVHKFGTITANIDQAACAERNIAVPTPHPPSNLAVPPPIFAPTFA